MYYVISYLKGRDIAFLCKLSDVLRSKWHSIDIFDGKVKLAWNCEGFHHLRLSGTDFSIFRACRVDLDYSEDWFTMSYGEPGLRPTSPSTFSSPDYLPMSYRPSESIKVAMVYPFSSVKQTPVFSILNKLKYATQSSHCSRICHPCGGRACWSHCS